MAKQTNYITVTIVSDSSGDLVTTGQKINYLVTDSVDSTLQKGGELIMDTITGGDTVNTWWAAVKQQVEDEEGI